MNASEQAQWLCLDDPSRITDRCKMVPGAEEERRRIVANQERLVAAQSSAAAPSPTGAMSNDAAYQRYLTLGLRESTRHFNRAEWETYCVGYRDDISCRGWMPGAVLAPVARWSAATCDSERQSLSLLSERINQSIAQLQVLAGLPPPVAPRNVQPPTSLSCNSQSFGSQTTTTCRPNTGTSDVGGSGAVSPGAAAYFGMQRELLRRREMEMHNEETKQQAARFDAVAALVQTQQNQFDARFREFESLCTKR